MTKDEIRRLIEDGEAVLGIEFGSTRIKAVLIDSDDRPVAQGDHEWENRLEDGIWTYSPEDIWEGLADCYRSLVAETEREYGVLIRRLKAIGISAMMHGYLAFDKEDHLLVPFRTWRNTITEEAAKELTERFHYPIPQRWSIAHLYQAMLKKEPHLGELAHINTLAGYVHWQLTGCKVLGVGDASGMFPVDPATCDYNAAMVQSFDELAKEKGYAFTLEALLPKCIPAGADAGRLTEKGAKLLDPTGTLEAGAPLCPPEGDAGTGMTATGSVAVRTGNVSAGTSIFSMVVLDKPLEGVYSEIDLVTTPTGKEVAMVHCNNCSSEINAWVGLFDEFAHLMGMDVKKGDLFTKLFTHAMTGDPDCGGLYACNFLSGEPVASVAGQVGVPMVARSGEAELTLANLMRAQIDAAFVTLKMGNDILTKKEHVAIDKLMAHGGLFRTKGVAQNILADAMGTDVTVMETAGEGGAWGIALLAAYLVRARENESLEDYLERCVFAGDAGSTVSPDPAGEEGMERFTRQFREGLAVENAAIRAFV